MARRHSRIRSRARIIDGALRGESVREDAAAVVDRRGGALHRLCAGAAALRPAHAVGRLAGRPPHPGRRAPGHRPLDGVALRDGRVRFLRAGAAARPVGLSTGPRTRHGRLPGHDLAISRIARSSRGRPPAPAGIGATPVRSKEEAATGAPRNHPGQGSPGLGARPRRTRDCRGRAGSEHAARAGPGRAHAEGASARGDGAWGHRSR